MAIGQVKWNAARGVYQAEYRDCAGKRRYVSDKNKKQCMRKLKEAEREVDQGVHTPASQTVTFGVALDAFIKDCERRNRIGEISRATLVEYRGVAERHVRPALGPTKLNKITTRLGQDLINDLLERYKTTAESARKVLYGTMNLAVERDLIRGSPFTQKRLKVPKRRNPITIPSKQDLRELLEITAQQPRRGERELVHAMRRVIVVLGYLCGMRKGEMGGLQWGNVNWMSGTVEIRHSYCPYSGLKGPKTKAGRRDVKMIPPVREALEKLWELQGRLTEGYVLRTANGKSGYASIGGVYWAPMMKAAGLVDDRGKPKFSVHALRHACVSSLAENGVPLLEISRLVGHSALDMTVGIYAHLFKDAEDRASPAIESVYRSLTRPSTH